MNIIFEQTRIKKCIQSVTSKRATRNFDFNECNKNKRMSKYIYVNTCMNMCIYVAFISLLLFLLHFSKFIFYVANKRVAIYCIILRYFFQLERIDVRPKYISVKERKRYVFIFFYFGWPKQTINSEYVGQH